MFVTDSGASGAGHDLGTLDAVRLEARGECAQPSAASCVAGGPGMESLAVSLVVCWII